ncbi:MAG: DoxX family membrane protein, partial [Ilumatobacteraceae bacterium]
MIIAAASDAPLDLGLLVLRVVFGLFLLAHGVRKVTSGIGNTAAFFQSIGMRWP